MDIQLRTEELKDHPEVFELTKDAFENMPFSDHTEHLLVERIRKSDAFIPELSIVAFYKEQLVGHILLSKLIVRHKEQKLEGLALGPISVTPPLQRKGIGTALMEEGHQRARKLEFPYVILIGHPTYYPRFGYQRASTVGVSFPFDVSDDVGMILILNESMKNRIQGEVVYPEPWGL